MEYSIDKSKKQPSLKELEDEELAVFKDAKKLAYKDDSDIMERLKQEVFDAFEAIKKERKDAGLDEFFDAADNQYAGIMPRREGSQFNLDCGLTKIKIDDVVRTSVAAHFEVDPSISVKPRPGFTLEGGQEVTDAQEDFLDYALDELIPYKDAFRLASYSASKKRVGMIKWIHKIKTEKRSRTETYKPEMEQRGTDPQTQEPIMVNKGIENFTQTHKEEAEKNPEKYEWIVKDLMANKPVTLDVEYDEVTRNDPFPKFIDNKNFYVRVDCEGYEGLCEEELYIERESYTYYQLKKLEEDYEFINVDKLLFETADDEKENKKRDDAYTKKYDILVATYKFFEKKGDVDSERKIVAYFAEDRKAYLGGIYYPFTVIECVYVPHYIKMTGTGFYKESLTEDLTDVHLAQNAILNFTLEAAWIANIITPITEQGSDVDIQFQEKNWTHGIPINAKVDKVRFLNEFMKQPDVGSLMSLYAQLGRIGDDVSMLSSYRTGRESPLDPNAPASKTLALLQESGKGAKDYVTELSKGFSIDANCVLKMYYEISQGDQLYISRRAAKVTGKGDPFKKLSRAEMIAKTSIQSMAHTFDFDKMNSKKEDVAIYNILRTEPLVAQNPQAVWTLLRNITKNWNQKWKNQVNQILPSLEELQQQKLQTAMQAVGLFVKGAVEQAKISGTPPEFDPEQLMGAIDQMVGDSVTQPSDDEMKNREEAAKGE